MSQVKSLLVSIVFLLVSSTVFSVQKGSNSAISIEPYDVFPNTCTNNAMLTFGFFQNGFALQDAITSCTFGSIFPVSGQVSLHGGTLYLGTDLIFQNQTNLATPGLIYGQNHVVDFCQSITGVPATYPTQFDNTSVFLNSDITLSGTVKFTGNCTLDGRYHGLSLGSNANIIVGHNASLELRNLDLSGVSGYNICCLDNSASLVLNNIAWGQSGNYTLTSGSILFDNTVNILGEYAFNFSSALTSTINTNSTLHFSTNSILSLGRPRGFQGQQPLAFLDNTSVLNLDNCTVNITSSGATLTNGLIFINGEVYLDILSTTSLGGLYLGNGQTQNNIMLELFPGAAINLQAGHFINNNVNTLNFFSASINKTFIRNPNTFFYINEPILLSNISLINATNGQTIIGPSGQMYLQNCFLNTSLGDFYITGTRVSTNVFLLAGNGNATITRGILPLAIQVKGLNNSLIGNGDMMGSLILENGGTQLNVQLTGAINSNISSAGSSLTLVRDLRLIKDVVITGSANVNLGTSNLQLQVQDGVWTSTIVFSGNGGTVNLASDLSLASQLTFKGNCTIQGNGNKFIMVSGGNIIVAPNSTLQFKNIVVEGLMGNNVRCNDDSSSIRFDTVHALLDGNYSFTTGSILFSNYVGFMGPYNWSYQTNVTSTISQNSVIHLDLGLTFSYNPSNQKQNLLNFTTGTSILSFNKNTGLYVGPGGMSLTTGYIIFDTNVSIIVENTAVSSSSGLSIGNNSSNNDVRVDILSGTLVDLERGVMTYANVNSNLWSMLSNSSILRLEAGTKLQFDQTLNLGDGLLQFSNSAVLSFVPGATIIGSTSIF